MLRLIFVFTLMSYGIWRASQGAFGALLFYLWLAYFRPDEWVWNAALIRSLNISLIAGIYLLLRVPMSSDRKVQFDLRMALMLMFLCLSAASTFSSNYFDWSWRYFQDFAKAVIVSLLLPSVITDGNKFRIVIMVIAYSLGFEGAKQGWMGLLLHPGGKNENELSLLGDNNGVAIGMLMLVPLFIALAKTTTTRHEKWVHQFFLIGVASRAIFTYSRGAFLAAGVMIIVYVLRSNQKFRSALGTAVVAGLILSVLPPAFWDRMSTIKTSEEELTDDSARSRPHFWRVAVEMANANPILGVGNAAYNREYNHYDFSNGLYGPGRSVHSMWFGTLAEQGYPGFVLFVLLILLAISAAGGVARRAKKQQIPMEFYHYGVALQTAFAAAVIGGSFIPWQYTEMLWHFLSLCTALRLVANNAPAPVPAPAPVRRPHVNTGFRPAPAAGRV